MRFTLGQGAYAVGGDTVEVTGLRASASITKSGGVSMSELALRVYGMPLDVMNRLSILGKPLLSEAANSVQVIADGSLCYSGTIRECWIDPNSAPDMSLVVAAVTGGLEKLKPVPATSYPGSVEVETVMQGLADTMGVPLENSGVSGITLSNVYLAGTALEQAQAVAQAADFNVLLDDSTLAIWPKDGQRGTGDPILVSRDAGMVGYPTHTQNGISVQMLYAPGIRYGATIDVRSLLSLTSQDEKAKGAVEPPSTRWSVYSVTHDLESETHGGRWFTTVECSLFGRDGGLAVAS
jgi:hypothetical protein